VSRLEQIESQIKTLTQEELSALRAWFAEFDADLWDNQLEADIKAGKLDELADVALKDHLKGHSREL
jgi:hypothetical protein